MDAAANPAAVASPPAPPAPPSAPPLPQPVRTWPRTVQSTLGVLIGSIVVGLVAHSVLQGSIQRPANSTGDSPLARIDLNKAGKAELRLLPGVGEKLAERIEAYRILNGPYPNIDELRKVPGLGPATLERIRPWLIVSGSNPAAADRIAESSDEMEERERAKKSLAKNTLGAKKLASLTEPVDVNTAGADELRKLPGIGPKLSQRIIDTRAQGLFKSVDELRRVPGIGPKTLAKLKPYVVAGGAASE